MTIRSRLLLLLLPPLTAFLLLAAFFFYFQLPREILLFGSIITLLIVFAIVFFIADRVSKPVRQLNQAALLIAAGNYDVNVHAEGPKEFVELANTLNIMNQCLGEHIRRLKESSLIKERMHGEYECSLLLQYYMLQKTIEEFSHPHLSLFLIAAPFAPFRKGLFLKMNYLEKSELNLSLLEADNPGFQGLYDLNQSAHLPKEELKASFIECHFVDQCRTLSYVAQGQLSLLVWSTQSQEFIKNTSNEIALKNKDFIFLLSSSFLDYFHSPEVIEKWLSKVLRHFAEDGLESIQLMLTNEISFLSKKQQSKHNFKIICLQFSESQL